MGEFHGYNDSVVDRLAKNTWAKHLEENLLSGMKYQEADETAVEQLHESMSNLKRNFAMINEEGL